MGNNVVLKILILNHSNQFYIDPVDKGFKWGRMCDEGLYLNRILPQSKFGFGVCGRTDSLAGVAGWVKFRLIHQYTSKELCSFVFRFDEPYDTNVYSRSATITDCDPKDRCQWFSIVTEYTKTKGYGYGETTVHLKIAVQNPDDIREFLVKKNDWRDGAL